MMNYRTALVELALSLRAEILAAEVLQHLEADTEVEAVVLRATT